MSLAISTSLAGLQAASTRLSGAARAVAGTHEELSASEPDRAAEHPSGAARFPPNPLPDNDLFKNLTDLKEAEISYKASAKAVAVIARTEESLLDILS